MSGLIFLFLFLFAVVAWYRLSFGLFFLLLFLPTYLIRYSFFSVPTTLLENLLIIIFLIWLIKLFEKNGFKKTRKNFKRIIKKNHTLFIALGIFILAASISIFTSGNLRAAAGEWKAFYLEPILFFVVLVDTLFKQPKGQRLKLIELLFLALILSGLATSLLAIYQHFTGWMVPWSFWENRSTYRVTGWYGYPNAVGLYLAPLVPLSLFLVMKYFKKSLGGESKKVKVESILLSLFFLLSTFTFLLSLIYAKSTGALIGIVAGVGVLLLFYKKTRWPAVILGIVGMILFFSLPNLDGLRQDVFFQDRSGQIRVQMWGDTTEFLLANPIWGAGLADFSNRIAPYHSPVNGESIEIYHLPHNLFLSIWVNLGILGLFAFVWIVVWYFRTGLMKTNELKFYLLSTMVIIMVNGLVDTPYIKNDLAIFFWFLVGTMVMTRKIKIT